MTKDKDKIQDWRSSGRRMARRELFNARVPFRCVGYKKDGKIIPCGKTTKEPPKDAPSWFDEIWPTDNRVLTQLQADHETKDLTINVLDYLNWRCPSCHRLQDMQTEKGVAQSSNNFWGEGNSSSSGGSKYW